MPSLIEIEGVGSSLAAACVRKNYRTIAKIAAATPSELASVSGISEKSAPQIIASAKSLLPSPRIQKATPKKKRRTVTPAKVATKATTAKAKTKTKSTDKAKGKPNRKASIKSSAKSSEKEKKMSGSDGNNKIKKLKKKIRKLKDEKKKILKKESKKTKKRKSQEI
jgi:Holliday junction resolvasome RuvABC DNA-binding subunit